MRRGFKAEAERRSAAARQALGITLLAALDPWTYATRKGVAIFEFEQLGLDHQVSKQLIMSDSDSWSAMTLQIGLRFGIVINPSHAPTRQRNDLMHELAHIDLQHLPARVEVSETGLLLLSDYSEEQEQEADWLAAAMLLPRDGLIRLRLGGANSTDIAECYGVSTALTEWRLRMTGVDLQMRRAHSLR